MKHQQIRRNSGLHFRFNLDDMSFACLSACHQIHRSNDNRFSNSAIVRRALRIYLEHLEGIATKRMDAEIIETKKAIKGIA